jgi:hypothetical protein
LQVHVLKKKEHEEQYVDSDENWDLTIFMKLVTL